MNAKTLEAVRKHGEQLLAIFPNATERDPVALCKKLRRVEAVAHKLAEDCCNWLSMESEEFAAREAKVYTRLLALLCGKSVANLACDEVFINFDARGYALKIDEAYMSAYNVALYKDWGGYGIIAPDLMQN